MIIDGKKISRTILNEAAEILSALSFQPVLIDIVVGNNPVIDSYVRIKEKRAAEINISFIAHRLPETISEQALIGEIKALHQTPHLCGMIVQLPLPKHINKQNILDCIDPVIDVDAITSENIGKLINGTQRFLPPTAGAIMALLRSVHAQLNSANVLIIGAGDLVGKPAAVLLLQHEATITVANDKTKNLEELCKIADIIISGAGVPKLVTAAMVKAGAIVIDAGTAESSGVIVGDVDFENVEGIAGAISPVPGGVGPVTVAMLLHNVAIAARESKRTAGNAVSD